MLQQPLATLHQTVLLTPTQKSPLEKQPQVRTPREVGLTFYFYSQDHDSHESDAVPTCYSRREYQSISNIVSSSYAGGAANFFGFSQVSSMAEDDLSAEFNAAMDDDFGGRVNDNPPVHVVNARAGGTAQL